MLMQLFIITLDRVLAHYYGISGDWLDLQLCVHIVYIVYTRAGDPPSAACVEHGLKTGWQAEIFITRIPGYLNTVVFL